MTDLPPQVTAKTDEALLRYRAHAAEVALLTAVKQLQQLKTGVDAMLTQAEAFVTALNETNRQFPLGDETEAGAKKLQFDAIRASIPTLKDASDEQIQQLMNTKLNAAPSTPDAPA